MFLATEIAVTKTMFKLFRWNGSESLYYLVDTRIVNIVIFEAVQKINILLNPLLLFYLGTEIFLQVDKPIRHELNNFILVWLIVFLGILPFSFFCLINGIECLFEKPLTLFFFLFFFLIDRNRLELHSILIGFFLLICWRHFHAVSEIAVLQNSSQAVSIWRSF